MPTNAEHQAAYRAKRAARLKELEALAKAVRTELASSNTDKGKRLYAMAVEVIGAAEKGNKR